MAFDPKNPTDSTVDESNLTLDELNQRLQAFQQQGKTSGKLDPDQVQRAIGQALQGMGLGNGVTAEGKGKMASDIADFVIKNGRYPNSQELMDTVRQAVTNRIKNKENIDPHVVDDPRLQNFANDQDTRNNLSKQIAGWQATPDTSADVTRVQGLIDAQNQTNTNQGSLNSYISGLPDALSSQENQMLGAYNQSQNQQFNDVLAPQMLESANARGALFSGDVGDLLSTGAGNVQGQSEQLQSQMQQQDLQFYFNAQYQNSLNQQLQGQSNYAQFLQGEQNRVLQANSNQFQTNQAQLTNANQQNIAGMQYQSQIRAYQKQLQTQQDYQNQQRQANQIGQIGQTVGGLALTGLGASTGNPYLIAAGIGTTVGGAGGAMSPQVGGH